MKEVDKNLIIPHFDHGFVPHILVCWLIQIDIIMYCCMDYVQNPNFFIFNF